MMSFAANRTLVQLYEDARSGEASIAAKKQGPQEILVDDRFNKRLLAGRSFGAECLWL